MSWFFSAIVPAALRRKSCYRASEQGENCLCLPSECGPPGFLPCCSRECGLLRKLEEGVPATKIDGAGRGLALPHCLTAVS